MVNFLLGYPKGSSTNGDFSFRKTHYIFRCKFFLLWESFGPRLPPLESLNLLLSGYIPYIPTPDQPLAQKSRFTKIMSYSLHKLYENNEHRIYLISERRFGKLLFLLQAVNYKFEIVKKNRRNIPYRILIWFGPSTIVQNISPIINTWIPITSEYFCASQQDFKHSLFTEFIIKFDVYFKKLIRYQSKNSRATLSPVMPLSTAKKSSVKLTLHNLWDQSI
jgi:hypothetical protein